MDKKKPLVTVKNYNTLFAGGLLCIIFGAHFLAAAFAPCKFGIFRSYSSLLMLSGAVILYLGITFIHKGWSVFSGLVLLLTGIFTLLIEAKIISFGMYQLWPFVVIITGLSLIPSGLYRYKRFVAVYMVPSAMLFVMGGAFLLFSLDIIKESFRSFAATWWPLLFVFVGIGLICMFFYTQHTQKVMMESGDDFDDEYEDIP